ncbi:hypothetical protein IHQ11_24480 [Priestia megaterium]|uniref:hypothetical protein n=1 Tax=Priestia megaterium TaxID=1404 RepID=UPI001B3A36EC|nr:hypothetical protein [Priestia megaterium]MBQ4869628.1 hypothetical protein [Priestia megaterium]MEB2277912.1 hypothetical protein [Bacillus sp. ILBB4]
MNHQKSKVLILTGSYGAGHYQTARVLYQKEAARHTTKGSFSEKGAEGIRVLL